MVPMLHLDSPRRLPVRWIKARLTLGQAPKTYRKELPHARKARDWLICCLVPGTGQVVLGQQREHLAPEDLAGQQLVIGEQRDGRLISGSNQEWIGIMNV